MKKYYTYITIIIITYNSNKEVISFIKGIPKIFKIVIVDNSNDQSLRLKFRDNKNIKIYFLVFFPHHKIYLIVENQTLNLD